jgi:hypothetical protein
MKYSNAAALRTALDQRLLTEANTSRSDIARLRRRVTDVFTARGSAEAPVELPDPPASWPARYAELAEDLQLSARDIEAAMSTLRTFWKRATDQRG